MTSAAPAQHDSRHDRRSSSSASFVYDSLTVQKLWRSSTFCSLSSHLRGSCSLWSRTSLRTTRATLYTQTMALVPVASPTVLPTTYGALTHITEKRHQSCRNSSSAPSFEHDRRFTASPRVVAVMVGIAVYTCARLHDAQIWRCVVLCFAAGLITAHLSVIIKVPKQERRSSPCSE